jgi:hypothetical protein
VAGGLPPLPEALRVVSVPGVRYAVYALSGKVIDQQTTMSSESHSTTTGGQVYTVGDQVHSTPIQTTTSVISTREDVIWVRTPDNRERPWTLINSRFQTRTGQIISILVRPLPSGDGDILLAYNHATGTLDRCPALKKAHDTSGVELPQWAANLAGGLWAAISLRMFLPMYAGRELYIGFVVAWLFATLIAVTISFFITTPLTKAFIVKKRDAAFGLAYMPGFRRFFEEGTAALEKRFKAL